MGARTPMRRRRADAGTVAGGVPGQTLSMTTRDPLPTLLLGLAIGVLGSFSDDLLGASAVVSILQIALWIVSAVLVVGAVVSMRGRRHTGHGGLRPTAS